MDLFEIGLVYKKGSQLFIAVASDTLISCKHGKAVKKKPTTKYDVVRSVTVEQISANWGITLDAFDREVGKYLGPPETCAKTRPRGARRSTAGEEDYWRRSRTGRIARPRV